MGYEEMAEHCDLSELVDWMMEELTEIIEVTKGVHNDTVLRELGDACNVLLAIAYKFGYNLNNIYEAAEQKNFEHGGKPYQPLDRYRELYRFHTHPKPVKLFDGIYITADGNYFDTYLEQSSKRISLRRIGLIIHRNMNNTGGKKYVK
jgi:predicted house-cleaning noncanonical NTP pyrophosphatase (MazG superfamily)